MHATRGSWVGRTFALAKSNDSSGGKKPRTRRSKEERKELVESFIKRHQKLNNGSFPSLNLTHKEVGGSYYIVREIVREIIQENRVLAPPKLLPGEHDMESFLEKYPLGSISVDPQIDVVSSNENHILVDGHQLTSEEHVLYSKTITGLDQGTLENGAIKGNAYVAAENKESEKPIDTEFLQLTSEEHVLYSKTITGLDQGTLENGAIKGNAYVAAENKESEKPIDTEFLVERGAEGDLLGENELDAYPVKTSIVVQDLEEEILPPEDHNTKSLLEQGSLDSVSIDPQIDVETLDESVIVSCHHQSTGEHVLDAGEVSQPDQGRLVNGVTLNGSMNALGEIEESRMPTYRESLLERGVDGNKAGQKELEGYHATSQIAEGELVETFPLRPVPHTDYELDAEFSKSVVFVGSLKENDTEDFDVEAVNSSVPDRLHFLNNSSEIIEKNTVVEMNGVSLDEKALPTKESNVLDINASTDLDVKNTFPAANKLTVAPGGVNAGKLRQATSDEAGAIEKHSNTQDGDSSKNKGNIPTLDRTKLGSWETSEKSTGQETNPLVAFIKACVTAFVKFWS